MISIHAPPRGATAPMRRSVRWAIFQFTPLREGRLGRIHRNPNYCCISIHAPPRGATDVADGQCAGGDAFQFTPLREGRPFQVVLRVHLRDFNSRPSARGDTPSLSVFVPGGIFQFTPLREGRRRRCQRPRRLHRISIHAPPRGATVKIEFEGRTYTFQFTPLREGRREGQS